MTGVIEIVSGLAKPLEPIAHRVKAPSPESIKAAREAAGLNQAEAAILVGSATKRPERTWQGYEAPISSKGHRNIPLASWELFLLLTDQHPKLKLQKKTDID